MDKNNQPENQESFDIQEFLKNQKDFIKGKYESTQKAYEDNMKREAEEKLKKQEQKPFNAQEFLKNQKEWIEGKYKATQKAYEDNMKREQEEKNKKNINQQLIQKQNIKIYQELKFQKLKKIQHVIIMNKYLLFIFLLNSTITQWEEIVQQDGYFSKIIDNNFVLVTFFNSETCPTCQQQVLKTLNPLEEEQVVNDENVLLLYLDYKKIEFFGNHYDLVDKQHMYLFVRNRIQKFEEFENLIGKPSLYSQTLEFLTNNINNVVVPIHNLEQLETTLEEKKILGLYLGEKNKSWKRYYELAVKNYDFDFYVSFDKELKNQIFQKMNKELIEEDVMVMLRSDELLDDHDKLKMVTFTKFYSQFEINKFFEFERYPKLRDCTWNKQNVEELFFKRHFMLVYIHEDEENPEYKWEFGQAIQYLPKRVIYSKCNLNNEHINHYLHLFMMGSSSFQPNQLYIVHVTPSQKVDIIPYTGHFKNEDIKNFMFTIYERNKFYFNPQNDEGDKQQFEAEELQLIINNFIFYSSLFIFYKNLSLSTFYFFNSFVIFIFFFFQECFFIQRFVFYVQRDFYVMF